MQLVSVIAKPFIRSTRVWDVKIKKSTFVLSSILQFKCIVSIWSVYVLVEGKLSIGGTFFWAWILALCVYSDWICVLDDLLCVTPYHVRGICVCLCLCVYCVWWWNSRVTSGIYGWAWVFWLGAFRVCSRCILMILYCSGSALW